MIKTRESAAILVVEDNPDNMKLFAWTLEDQGYDFQGADSAEAAFEILQRRRFDLILMDISLPGIDGKEAVRRLRDDSRYADLPIFAVTAHAIKGEEESIRASGITRIVTKPIDEDLLIEAIRSQLESERSLG